jgi:hypothetical protein
MADLATLLTQLNRNAYIMDNIINATYIPENITHAGLAHCKEYLDKALDHMIKMGDSFRSIAEQHPQDLNTHDVRTASAKQDHLIAQFKALATTLWERASARPKHSTMTPSASGQSVSTDTPTAEAQKLKEAVIRTNVKYDQLRLDLEQLATSVTANEWTCSEDHLVTLGLESRSTWRDQHATISRNLIEIDGLAKLHNLTDIQDRMTDARSEIAALSNRIDLTLPKIKAAPNKLPSYPRDASEDLINFEDKSQTAAVDNRISRRDQLERIREGLTSETAAKLPLNDMIDTE